MTSIIKTILPVLFVTLISASGFSQALASAESEVPKAVSVKETAPIVAPASNKEVTITIKNSAEKPVAIFAGPKIEIRNPKVRTLGGLSLNKLYLYESEVVCLMDMRELRPTSCAVIKPGMTYIEVNPSGTAVTSK